MARPRRVQHAVGDGHRAVAAAGADLVEVSAHVDRAAEVSEAGADAAAESHASVARSLDDDDPVVRRTRHVQRLHRAVVDRRRRRRRRRR